MIKRLALGLVSAAVFASVACSSSDSGTSSNDECTAFCGRLQSGSNCGQIQVYQCISDCRSFSQSCPVKAPELLHCLAQLSYQCVAAGQAVAEPRGTASTDPASLSVSSGTLDVEDATCADLAHAFQSCTSNTGGSGGSGNSGGGGSGGTANSGGGGGGNPGGSGGSGNSAGSGGSGNSAGSGGSGNAAGSGGSGGNCDSAHPFYCASTNTCWDQDTDCASVTSCGGSYIACSTAQSAQKKAVDCTYQACVATPATCTTDAAHPQYCPGSHGAYPGCWQSGTACSTVVYCVGVGSGGCWAADQSYDCTQQKCLTPKVAESTDAACSNGVDDDGNGYIDCKDFHCSANPSVTVCKGENDDTACSNGIDDDGNGYIDCKDANCRISPAVTTCPSEKTDAECHDGVDNDGNGKIDCVDLSCFGNPFTTCP